MRVKRGVPARSKHKKILKAAKGMQHNRTRSFRLAKQAVIFVHCSMLIEIAETKNATYEVYGLPELMQRLENKVQLMASLSQA